MKLISIFFAVSFGATFSTASSSLEAPHSEQSISIDFLKTNQTTKVKSEHLDSVTKHLIDVAKIFYSQADLILDRQKIYETIGINAGPQRTIINNVGEKTAIEEFPKNHPFSESGWIAKTQYQDYFSLEKWSIEIEFRYVGPHCISSRAAEKHWEASFTYDPLGTEALIERSLREFHNQTPIDPHGGNPYQQTFLANAATKADIIFAISRGGCVSRIISGKFFSYKKHSNEKFFRR